MSWLPRERQSVKDGSDEFVYKEQSCIDVSERILPVADPGAPSDRRDRSEQEVPVFAVKEIQDDWVSRGP